MTSQQRIEPVTTTRHTFNVKPLHNDQLDDYLVTSYMTSSTWEMTSCDVFLSEKFLEVEKHSKKLCSNTTDLHKQPSVFRSEKLLRATSHLVTRGCQLTPRRSRFAEAIKAHQETGTDEHEQS